MANNVELKCVLSFVKHLMKTEQTDLMSDRLSKLSMLELVAVSFMAGSHYTTHHYM